MTRSLQPCGTAAAYKRHIAHHQAPCEPCVIANRKHIAAFRRAAEQARAYQDDLFRQLLDLIAGECQKAGMLP